MQSPQNVFLLIFLLCSRITSGLIFSFGFYDYFVKIAVCVAVTRIKGKTGTGKIGCAHVRTRNGCDPTTRSISSDGHASQK